MAHEKERELLERASYLIGNPGANISGSTDCACDEWQRDYKYFLSTLPEEKEETHCKLKQEIHTCVIWQDRKAGCWGCVNYIEFNPSK